MLEFTPADWYWRADDGRIYSSAHGNLVPESYAGLADRLASGGFATPWPRDDAGAQTDAALDAVLHALGLPGPGGNPVPVAVSSAQAKIQCARTPGGSTGKTLLDDVAVAAQTAGIEAQIWFTEAKTWERLNPYVVSLSSGLKLTSEQVDQLFIEAAKIAA